MDDKNLTLKAVVAYLFSIVGGLIIYFTEKDNQTLKFHSAQSIAYGLIYIVVSILSRILGLFIKFLPGIISLALGIVSLIVIILGIIKAAKNEEYRFPIIAEVADKVVEILK
ncbi:MAG: DUF4870 domain-containing protein [Bacillota bacterium]|nr:DUF4870 domain-containing protein [Bacillota bacterium]